MSTFRAEHKSPLSIFLTSLAVAVACGITPARADFLDSTIDRISAAQQADGTALRFTFAKPATELPNLHVLDTPPRLMLDFVGMPESKRRIESFNVGLVATATVVSVPGRTRVVLVLRRPVRPVLRLDGGDLLLELSSAAPGSDEARPPVPVATEQPLAAGRQNGYSASKTGNGKRSNAETLIVELAVNGIAVPGFVRVERLADGSLAVPIDAWKAMRLITVGEPLALPDGQRGYTLESVKDLTYQLDRARLTLTLTAPAAAFDSSAYSLESERALPPNAASPGAYLNYSIAATQPQGGSMSYGGLLEAVFFNRWGSLVSGAVVRGDGHANTGTRTDTYWRTDWPASMKSLILGDTVGSDGGWSRPVRYGGVRYGRDFSLSPGYISYPLPAISGSVALPSTVDVLVNNRQQSSTSVQPGPFGLTNVPVVSGAGELNLVVRDLRGIETVISQSYYTSPRLLAAGQSDFSMEAGALRRNYGIVSNDYGSGFAAGTYRYGFSPALTAGGRLELQGARQAGGVDATGLLGTLAVMRAAAAWSRNNENDGSRDGSGAHLLAAIERSTPRGGGSLQWERFAAGFVQFGATARESRPRERLQASAGMAFGSGLSAGISYIRQTTWAGDDFTLAAANLGAALWSNAYLSVFASKQLNVDKGWSAGVNLMVPLQQQRTLLASSNRDNTGKLINAVEATSPTPSGPGWGWRARASDLESQHLHANATLNTNYGQFTVEGNAGKDANAIRLSADGSVGWLEGLPFATRRIDQGAFAVVRVGDLEGVPVSRSGQVIATTDRNGLALVPGLLPYQSNVLTIDPDQLPFDINIGGVKNVVVPYARSGVTLDFPVRRSRNVLAILQQPNGAPIPPGTRVTVTPGNLEFIVAKRGEVYLMDLQESNRINVRWKDGGCSLPLALGPAKGSEAQVGPLICGDSQ
jgi:outer membrane usher protein